MISNRFSELGQFEPIPGSSVRVYRRCACTSPSSGRQLGARCLGLADAAHGSWYFSVWVLAPDGRARVRRGGFPTAADARQAAAPLTGVRDPEPAVRSWTVRAWLERWLEIVDDGLRPTTSASYRRIVRRSLIPQLGSLRLSKLRTRDVQRALDRISRRVTPTGGRIAASTVHRIRSVLRSSLNEAWRQGLVGRNPAWRSKVHSPGRPSAVLWTAERERLWRQTGVRPSVAVWDTPHVVAFLESVADDPLHAMWRLIVLRGLRRGEVSGLRWGDLDFETGRLSISRQILIIDGGRHVGPPKSAAGVRTIALDEVTVAGLWRVWLDQFERTGVRPDEETTMFLRDGGRPVGPDWLTRHLQVLIRRAGLPPVRLHDLRHGAASLAAAAGVPLKVIQADLGHSSIVTTADTYITVLTESFIEAAAATAAYVLASARRRMRLVAASQA
ncbi:tyrosine-type recombinase/integrase [Longispora urticae]